MIRRVMATLNGCLITAIKQTDRPVSVELAGRLLFGRTDLNPMRHPFRSNSDLWQFVFEIRPDGGKQRDVLIQNPQSILTHFLTAKQFWCHFIEIQHQLQLLGWYWRA